MKRTLLLSTLAWIFSLAAAFLVGKSTRPAPKDEDSVVQLPRTGSQPLPMKRSASSQRRAPGETNSALLASGGQGARILARQSPRQAVVELAQLVDPVERAKGFLSLVDILQADEFEGVVADFRALGVTEQRMSEYGILLHAWGKVDPVGALDYAMTHTGTSFAKETILASWAAESPEAALEFARNNHEGDEANPLLVGVIRGVAPGDLGQATDLLQELPYSDERGKALRSMLPFVLEAGVDDAISWTGRLADPRLRSGAITFLLSEISKSAPGQAARIMAGLEDREAAERVADDIGGSLARSNLDEAIAWSEALEPDIRSEAVEGVISLYASRDARAASQWLESLSGDTNLDAAIRRFAWHTQAREPELAANWIHRMTDERRRNEMYSSVLNRWLRNDAAAAERWIENTPDLPAGVTALPGRLRDRLNDSDNDR